MRKGILKTLIYTFVIVLSSLFIAYLLISSYYPNFGGDVSEEKQTIYQSSLQYKKGKFHNTNNVPKEQKFKDRLKSIYKFYTAKVTNGRPKHDLKSKHIDSVNVANYKGKARMIWFGHSSFLLQLKGKTILLDPMFGKVAAPHPLLGEERFNKELPIKPEHLSKIDAVLFSHDHYDHLDYETILKIKDKTNHFYVPLGVGTHLEAWGIASQKITELDWWEETTYQDLKLICTPAQHFSGRKLENGQSTLWSSWVIQSTEENIYFSGDTGYSNHFNEIGTKYGPFDIALLECGQYNKMWPDIHMMPEQTAQAGKDLKAKKIMPIHWAGFKLALHDWTDPIKRVKIKANQLNIPVITPQIGDVIYVKDSLNIYTNWWEGL